MKYTKEQIEQAFYMWEQDIRTQPDDFMSEEERLEAPAKEIAEKNANELVMYMGRKS